MTTVQLGTVLQEFKSTPPPGTTPEVLTLTERNGFVRQADRFNKRLATEDVSKYKFIGRDDFAFNPYLLWAGAIARNRSFESGVISPLYPTFRVVEGNCPAYVGRLLLSDALIGAYDNIAFGSVPRRRRSSVKDFLGLEIPSPPPFDEQRRIAAILDKADELRTKRRQALAHLDTLSQSIFHSMFGDPVTNPHGWPLSPLSDLGNLERGISKHRPRNDPKLLRGKYPLVQTGDVAGADAYLTTFSSTYSELGLRQSRLWPAGTLCITIAANIAKTAILRIDACFPDSVVGFTAAPSTTEYVRVWFSFLQATLEARAPESAQKNINLAILRALPVPVPPVELQQTFAMRVAAVERLKGIHRKHLAELDALFASLQHHAFKGEL